MTGVQPRTESVPFLKAFSHVSAATPLSPVAHCRDTASQSTQRGPCSLARKADSVQSPIFQPFKICLRHKSAKGHGRQKKGTPASLRSHLTFLEAGLDFLLLPLLLGQHLSAKTTVRTEKHPQFLPSPSLIPASLPQHTYPRPQSHTALPMVPPWPIPRSGTHFFPR